MKAKSLPPVPALVGREDESGALRNLLAVVRSGEPGLATLVGEAGIGKTRLLAELRHWSEQAGFEVVTGSAAELEQHVPFGPFIDALDRRLRNAQPQLVRALGPDRFAELGTIFTSLDAVGERGLDAERYRSHHAVSAALEALAAGRPLLLCLDDVHWADPASLELILYLLRQTMARTLIVLAYRPSEASPRLLAALDSATRSVHIELSPLSVPQAAQLLQGAVAESELMAIYVESGGNPFYLEALAKSRTPDGIPAAVSQGVARELARLPATTREFAQACAVAGEPFEVGLAGEIAGLDEPQALAALDDLIALDIVRGTETSREFAFRHPIVRRAVYDAAKPGWRIAAHATAARALAHRGGPLSTQAHHVERSARVGDEQSITVLVEAGRQAAARAPAAAARWFEAALALLPADVSRHRQLELLTLLAGASASVGRLSESLSALNRVLDLLPADDIDGRLRTTAMLAATEQGMGRVEIARRLLDTALAGVTPSSPEAAAMKVAIAENSIMTGDWSGATAASLEALQIAENLDDRPLAVTAAAQAAYAAQYEGRMADAAQYAEYAATEIDGLMDVELGPDGLGALGYLAYAEASIEWWSRAQRHTDRGIRLCRATGLGFRFTSFLLLSAANNFYRGHLGPAREAADAGVESASLLDNDPFLIATEAVRCWIASRQGDTAIALAAGQRAVDATARAPGATFDWLAHACFGEALANAGHLDPARKQLAKIGGLTFEAMPPSTRPRWFRVLAELEIADGRLDAADEAVRNAVKEAEAIGLPARLGDARYAQAALLLALGDAESTATTAEESAALYEAAETPVDAARARELFGQALAATGDLAGAQREYRAAHQLFSRYGAAGWADQVAKRLRGLGTRVSRETGRRTESHQAMTALSRREREVADRVVQGRTNRQIAAELYISEKTVEAHVSRVFAKLGVSSRVQLALEFHRQRP